MRISIKKILAATILSLLVLLIGVSSKILAVSPPTCSIETWTVNDAKTRYHTKITWNNTYWFWWEKFYWGDEAVTGKQPVGFFGSSGTVEWEHEYQSGTWEQWSWVYGYGGSGNCKQTITVAHTNTEPSCEIKTYQDSWNPNLYHSNVTWNNVYTGSWYPFYWGDEAVTGSEAPRIWGPNGSAWWDHVYRPGTWEQWISVGGPGGWKECKTTITLASQNPASCTINTTKLNNNRYKVSLSWQNAYNQWFSFYWGDEAETGKQPTGFLGSSGSAEWEHEYPPGSWQQWTNISGPSGNGSCLQTVTIE